MSKIDNIDEASRDFTSATNEIEQEEENVPNPTFTHGVVDEQANYRPSRVKRSRVELLSNPLHSEMYRLIIKQLAYDGYISAASQLTDATGVIPTSINEDGNRLMRVVANGLNVESVSARSRHRFMSNEVVERYLDLSKLYIPLQLSQSWSMHRRLWKLSEQFSSAPLDGAIRDVSFSSDGNFVGCAGTNGLAVIFAMETLHDVMNMERIRQVNKGERPWRRHGHNSGDKLHLTQSRNKTNVHSVNDHMFSMSSSSTFNIAGVASAGSSAGENSNTTTTTTTATNTTSSTQSNVATDSISATTITLANVNEITEFSLARKFTEHSQSVEFIRFHPSKTVLMTGARDGEVIVRDYSLPSSSILLRIRDAFPARDAAFHPSGEYALFATDHYLPRLVNLSTGVVLTPSPTYNTTNVDNIASTTANANNVVNSDNIHNKIKSSISSNSTNVNINSNDSNTSPTQHSAALTSVAYDKEGRRFATASLDGSYMLYDAIGGKVISSVISAHSEVPVTSVRFSKSGNMVLTAGMDSIVRLWDLRKLSNSSLLLSSNESSTPAHTTKFNKSRPAEVMAFGEPARCEHRSIHATFTADESHILCQSSSLEAIYSYCVYTGMVACRLTTQPTFIQRGMAASPVDNMFVTGGDDNRIRLWAPS